ncbi:kelch domain-containing protein 3-like, partial [Salvelinus sp. IW2-2015]|uniref:kelch domain-containing protein 3-like n=1 Tax=Salvelinus sp. IW2-2015 TaxID=2691554 RepID=UPI0038D40C03
MSEQGVQEGTEHATLRDPCVEEQRGGFVVSYPHHLGAARQEVQDPLAEGDNHRWFTPKISGTVPGARDGHSACILGKAMYIFGGYEQLADCFSNDIHKLDTTTMAWSLINARGTPARWRDFHSATILALRCFVFGGRADRFGPFHSNNEIYCNKIRCVDTETNSWLNTATTQLLPEGRRSHSA